MANELSHTNQQGKANMVDVSAKPPMVRTATATGFIRLKPETISLIKENQLKKGDVLTVAEIAGIQAAKNTSMLIPLCHPLQLTKVDVKCRLTSDGIIADSFTFLVFPTYLHNTINIYPIYFIIITIRLKITKPKFIYTPFYIHCRLS